MQRQETQSMRVAAIWLVAIPFTFITGCHSISRPEDAANLSGTVYVETFFGPPNYGENPETDRIEQADILRLDRPLKFCKSDGTLVVVSEVQIIGFGHALESAHV